MLQRLPCTTRRRRRFRCLPLDWCVGGEDLGKAISIIKRGGGWVGLLVVGGVVGYITKFLGIAVSVSPKSLKDPVCMPLQFQRVLYVYAQWNLKRKVRPQKEKTMPQVGKQMNPGSIFFSAHHSLQNFVVVYDWAQSTN